MTEQIESIKEDIKKDLKEQVKRPRPEYLVPSTRFAKADQILKITRAGKGLAFYLPKDVCFGMNLKRGQLIRVTLELFPEDAAKLHEQ